MKISLQITVDVDTAAWANTYGIAPKDVRDDVKTYAVEQLRGAAAAEEQLWTVQAAK